MKRVAILFLVLLYLIPAVGISVNAHWCGQRLMQVKVNATETHECMCGAEMPSGCCKNVHVVFKITDNQDATSELTFAKNDFGKQIFFVQVPFQVESLSEEVHFSIPNFHAPPPKGNLPLYLNNRVFRV